MAIVVNALELTGDGGCHHVEFVLRIKIRRKPDCGWNWDAALAKSREAHEFKRIKKGEWIACPYMINCHELDLL